MYYYYNVTPPLHTLVRNTLSASMKSACRKCGVRFAPEQFSNSTDLAVCVGRSLCIDKPNRDFTHDTDWSASKGARRLGENRVVNLRWGFLHPHDT